MIDYATLQRMLVRIDAVNYERLAGAVETLERNVGAWCKSFESFAGRTGGIHLDVANLYPAGEALSASVVALNSHSALWGSAPRVAGEVYAALTTPLSKLSERIKSLIALADERHVCRAEIAHYRDKVTRLANDGLENVKSQAKAESNQEK